MAMDPEELARKLENHPDHAGCCPVCRRATAETWASLQAVTQAVGAMLGGAKGGKMPGPFSMLGRLLRGRGVPEYPELEEDATEEPEVPHVHVQGPNLTRAPMPQPGAEVHTHPELGWEDAWTHAHLEADLAHTHTAEGFQLLEAVTDEP